MRYWVVHRWLKNRWFAALLLTGFFCHALIPAGFMPGPGGLMLCNDYAAMPAMVGGATATHDVSGMDMAGMGMSHMASHLGHGGQSPHDGGMGVCCFAAAASALAFNHVAVPSALLQIGSSTIAFPHEKSLPRGTIVPTSLPRGPPVAA